ncbi:MAG: hypothetical protein AABZ60_00055 [Planctomycetota bacterium]
MIQINLLPENLKETSGPSSVWVFVLIFVEVLIVVVAMGLYGWLHFTMNDLRNTEQQLNFRLQTAKKKTKDYEALKAEKAALEKKTTLVRKLVEDRILWSNRIQDLSIFINDRRVWLGDFKINEAMGVSRSRTTAPPENFMQVIINCYSASRDLNIPNDFRKDIVLTDWWKEHFQENGINDPAYEIKALPSELYKEEFYHTFTLELDMKSAGDKKAEQKPVTPPNTPEKPK